MNISSNPDWNCQMRNCCFLAKKTIQKNGRICQKKCNKMATKKFENIAENLTEPGGETQLKMTWIFTVNNLRVSSASRRQIDFS